MSYIWNLKSTRIPLDRAAVIGGFGQNEVRNMLLSGVLGTPPPASSAAVLNLCQIARLVAVREAARATVAEGRMITVLPCFAGSIYVRLALTELTKGRWAAGRGLPNLTHDLWRRCRSAEGQLLIEQQLPLAAAGTKRFACFSKNEARTCDNLSELHDAEVEWPLKVLDSWYSARRLQKALPGTLFTTEIN